MYKGFEGARGWLAWVVVLSHIVSLTPLYTLPHTKVLFDSGDFAVRVFIMISGFVVTNLIMKAQETYPIYIARRALRLYPTYLISLAIGMMALPLTADLMTFYTMNPGQARHYLVQLVEWQSHPMIHILLHLSMMHGMVPNNVLPESQYMFVSPAWSLSLEWQFYLIAPPFVAVAINRPIMACSGVVALLVGYNHGLFGNFYNPSLIFGSGWFFLIGIVTRIYIDAFPYFKKFPIALLIGLLPIVIIERSLTPLLAWSAIVAYIRSDAITPLLDSKVAGALGARSFSVYLLHLPILIASAWVVWGPLHMRGYSASVVAGLVTICLTAALSDAVYRLVERPFIQFGKRFRKSDLAFCPDEEGLKFGA